MTTIIHTTKANPTETTTAPTARRSTCIFEQMPVSELVGDDARAVILFLPRISILRGSLESCFNVERAVYLKRVRAWSRTASLKIKELSRQRASLS
jgi:hypothetical protein